MVLLRLCTLLSIVVTISTNVINSEKNGDNFELLILHNNDMHARFEQTSQLSGVCSIEDREAGKCYGGFPRVAHVVKEARKAASNGTGPPVLYLNAGDTYTGTAWFTIYKWKIAAECINALQPDAVCLGSHDLEESDQNPFIKNLNVPILASNVVLRTQNVKDVIKIHKSSILNIGKVKVGLIGYITPVTNSNKYYDEMKYVDEVKAIQEEVDKLKEMGVNILIVLGNSDQNKDMEIAKKVNGLDLIISGYKNIHSWYLTNSDQKDVIETINVEQSNGQKVLVVKSFAYSKYLGMIKLTFNDNGVIVNHITEPILLDKTIPQDKAAIQILNEFRNDISKASEEVIGQTAVVLDGNTCSFQECNLGNLITDAIVYYYSIRYEGDNWSDAPIAIINSDAIWDSIEPTNRPADITLQDLLIALPSPDNVVAVTITGETLLNLLEQSIAEYNDLESIGSFLQYSGIRVTYDVSEPVGSRVVNAVARCWSCNIPEFYIIEDTRTYKILIPESLAENEMFNEAQHEQLPYDLVTCLKEYIESKSPVYPEVSWRIIKVNDDKSSTTGSTNTTDDSTINFLSMTLLMSSFIIFMLRL